MPPVFGPVSPSPAPTVLPTATSAPVITAKPAPQNNTDSSFPWLIAILVIAALLLAVLALYLSRKLKEDSEYDDEEDDDDPDDDDRDVRLFR